MVRGTQAVGLSRGSALRLDVGEHISGQSIGSPILCSSAISRSLRPTDSLWRKGIYSGAIWLMGWWCVNLHQRAAIIPYILLTQRSSGSPEMCAHVCQIIQCVCISRLCMRWHAVGS